jgi:hypothetical protein
MDKSEVETNWKSLRGRMNANYRARATNKKLKEKNATLQQQLNESSSSSDSSDNEDTSSDEDIVIDTRIGKIPSNSIKSSSLTKKVLLNEAEEEAFSEQEGTRQSFFRNCMPNKSPNGIFRQGSLIEEEDDGRLYTSSRNDFFYPHDYE